MLYVIFQLTITQALRSGHVAAGNTFTSGSYAIKK